MLLLAAQDHLQVRDLAGGWCALRCRIVLRDDRANRTLAVAYAG